MRKRKLYSTEYEDVPETVFNPPDRPSVFIPTRYDWYLQAAFQGFCANPAFANLSQPVIASMAIGHTTTSLEYVEQERPSPGNSPEIQQ